MITKFESFDNEDDITLYWELNTKQPYLRFALKKLGMTTDQIEHWCHIFDKDRAPVDIYMFRTKIDNRYDWLWAGINYTPIKDNIGKEKFMGKIVITDVDIDAEKYNL